MTDTLVLDITKESLALAKEIITVGGLVAFPTETVYGLGASAFDQRAVDGIYEVKGRPQDNPLIAHVHTDYDISKLVCDIPAYAEDLKKAFLPGPLTMVYKSKGTVAPNVSRGLGTLAVRVPAHEGCQRFLKYLDLPIAAPSANVSKHISPVTSTHVKDDLNGKIPLILEGGRSSGGIESTVLDVTGDIPAILRKGSVTLEMIRAVAGECEYADKGDGRSARSPGTKYKHYSPVCETKYFAADKVFEAALAYDLSVKEGRRTSIICDSEAAKKLTGKRVFDLGLSAEEITANLYYMLREAEKEADMIIGIGLHREKGEYEGVFSRMEKAFGMDKG